MARSGYTLPVFAVASAKAALVYLLRGELRSPIALNLLPEITEIPIQQIALLDQNTQRPRRQS
jgi:cobalt-precorrin-5B (C1)-methyltransferase